MALKEDITEDMQAVILAELAVSVDVQRAAITRDSQNAPVEGWQTLHAEVPCRLRELRASEELFWNKETVRATHIGYLAVFDSNVPNERDRLVYGSRVFRIVRVENPGEVDHHLELHLLEVVDASSATGGGFGGGGFGD